MNIVDRAENMILQPKQEWTVIDGETGLTVPEHDPAALADALARVLRDPGLAARLSDQARTHVEQGFSLEQSVKILRSLFPERG